MCLSGNEKWAAIKRAWLIRESDRGNGRKRELLLSDLHSLSPLILHWRKKGSYGEMMERRTVVIWLMPYFRGKRCEGVCCSALVDVMEKRSAILRLCRSRYDAFSWLNGELFELHCERRGMMPLLHIFWTFAGLCVFTFWLKRENSLPCLHVRLECCPIHRGAYGRMK